MCLNSLILLFSSLLFSEHAQVRLICLLPVAPRCELLSQIWSERTMQSHASSHPLYSRHCRSETVGQGNNSFVGHQAFSGVWLLCRVSRPLSSISSPGIPVQFLNTVNIYWVLALCVAHARLWRTRLNACLQVARSLIGEIVGAPKERINK